MCLGYLFKPYLKRNIGVTRDAMNFAVSLIARDVRDYAKFLEFILETIERKKVDSVRGCGRFFSRDNTF